MKLKNVEFFRIMEKIKKFYKKYKVLLILDLFLVLGATFYYLFFVNRGLIASDEGYYVHFSERIANGEVAYKDFILQYTPGYFYLLALLYKIFGVQILVGRFVSLLSCLFILISVLFLLYLYKIESKALHIATAVVITALGYPLLHIPLVIWPCVLITILIQINYLYWYRTKKYQFLISIGLLLGLIIFFRQSLGIALLLLMNILLVISKKDTIIGKFKSLVNMNIPWILLTGIWMYYFFFYEYNLSGFFTLISLSKHFSDTFAFSYPPLGLLLQPFGLFKLLPYYFPLFYIFVLLIKLTERKVDWEKFSFAFLTLGGFFSTIYPASDLLHVYPFLGVVLSSFLVLYFKQKKFFFALFLVAFFVLIGIYMTFFKKSFRYDAYFLQETTPLSLPKTKGILIDRNYPDQAYISQLYTYITEHTKTKEYIFVYPFQPLLYTLLDRRNPSGVAQFILFEAPDSIYSESRVINDIKEKKVRYIIVDGIQYSKKKIEQFILAQKKVRVIGTYDIYEIRQ